MGENNTSARSPVISIFGGSRYLSGTREYEETIELGRLLATDGFRILTGGYFGLMEAASRGADEAGGLVAAVTHAPWGPPNKYVGDYKTAPSLFAGLEALVLDVDGFVAMRGGMGTVTEVAMVWVHLQAHLLPQEPPLILVGREWTNVIEAWSSNFAVNEADLSLIDLVDSPREALRILSHKIQRRTGGTL
jgi:uncharacterized protein (TIGR00725 family)